VPTDVGGRFSVLSPVGLLPAALVGIDIEGLLTGAQQALTRSESDDLLQNPPALYAALHWEADVKHGAGIHVVMPYTDRLRDFAEWYRQLWAESLGKRADRAGRTVNVGPTPVAAVGATDQHSQVQLFMEGPFNKVITFVTVEDFGQDVNIPRPSPKLPSDLEYLPGHTLGELLRAEYEATSAALAQMGRMNCTLHLPDLTAATVGEALMFYQVATGYAGVWYGIDPFDQPGVELGKRLTFAAMGRPGYQPVADHPSAPTEEV
jgi:glucose-6-phosphate isomerase